MDTGEEIMDKEKTEAPNWVEVIVDLFKKLLSFNYHEYGTKKDF